MTGSAAPGTAPSAPRERAARGGARTRLLSAALDLIRRNGLTATSVDDLCAAAAVTKGAFFHHFPSKEALAVAAAEHWSHVTGALFDAADYHRHATAAARVLAYLDLRADLVRGEPDPARFSCLAGTMVQEAYATSSAVRDACAASIFGHAATLEPDLAEALADAGRTDVDPAGLARHTQAVIQGAFVLAKAADDPSLVGDSLRHLRDYLTSLIGDGLDDLPADRSEGVTA